MSWVKKEVYVVTAWFKDDSYSSPSESFFADTLEEAERKKEELLEDPTYEDVWISDEPEEHEFWRSTVYDFLDEAERTNKSLTLDEDQKARKLAELMTYMEIKYGIPLLRNPEWESRNAEVIEVYRAISNMRNL